MRPLLSAKTHHAFPEGGPLLGSMSSVLMRPVPPSRRGDTPPDHWS